MTKDNNLTEGNIFEALIKLALPIIGTAFVQMSYNLMDMFWLGRVGSKAVAASGTAGFFTWLAMAFIIIPKIGAEVGVSQSIGKGDSQAAKDYIKHAIQLTIIFAIIYGCSLLIFRHDLISFFDLENSVTEMAISYLTIIAIGIIFFFINPIFTAIFNGYGDSKTPFIINVVGLIVNIVLDPIMIFGMGSMPKLGIKGAAIATIIAQFIVTMLFVYKIRMHKELFSISNLISFPKKEYLKKILNLGLPAGLQSGSFTIFSILIAKIIAKWGATPIAVQKIGSQIEAISWMSANGFATALSAFVGQNYGAKKWDRIHKGYYAALKIVGGIGIFATILLIFGARPIFSSFVPNEKETIEYGVVYLQILGLSQLFMVLEIATAGAFNGLGKTIPPSIVGIIFTGLRVPAALILSSESLLGLNGVWWSISMSSILKGIVLTIWFWFFSKKLFANQK